MFRGARGAFGRLKLNQQQVGDTVNILKTANQLLKQRCKDQRGVAVVEYAVMLALISIAVATFGQGISGSVMDTFSRVIDIL